MISKYHGAGLFPTLVGKWTPKANTEASAHDAHLKGDARGGRACGQERRAGRNAEGVPGEFAWEGGQTVSLRPIAKAALWQLTAEEQEIRRPWTEEDSEEARRGRGSLCRDRGLVPSTGLSSPSTPLLTDRTDQRRSVGMES